VQGLEKSKVQSIRGQHSPGGLLLELSCRDIVSQGTDWKSNLGRMFPIRIPLLFEEAIFRCAEDQGGSGALRE
jgi:hypothetical protein